MFISDIREYIGAINYWKKREFSTCQSTLIPSKKQIWLWRNGFLTISGKLYDFQNYPPEDYISDTARSKFGRVNGQAKNIPRMKIVFHRLLEHNYNQQLPEIYGIIEKGSVYSIDGDVLSNNIHQWLDKITASHDKVIYKPSNGSKGKGVSVIHSHVEENFVDSSLVTEAIDSYRNLSNSPQSLVTEYIQQATYSSNIFPDAANTLRILTLWDYKNDQPYIADAIHRFGTNKSKPVDNWNSGGISVDVDMETGELLRGVRLTQSKEVQHMSSHPDTDERIFGVNIPNWTKIIATVKKMASELRYIPMIGWDILVTERGFKVIEGNTRPSVDMMQVHKPLLVDKRTRQFFTSHNII